MLLYRHSCCLLGLNAALPALMLLCRHSCCLAGISAALQASIIIIIIIKQRAELETTRKKALPVGGLIHSHTDKCPHANPGNVQHSRKENEKIIRRTNQPGDG